MQGNNRQSRLKWCLLGVGCAVVSANAALNDIADQQLIHQQERQKAIQEALDAKAPDIRLLPNLPKTARLDFPDETPCFVINHIDLLERDKLPWTIPLYKLISDAQGRCLGSEGIKLLISTLQNQLVSYGYITTRVVVPEQDISSGSLQLLFVPGTVRAVKYSDDSDTYASLHSAMPMRAGELLNLRDIEQGLENLQRLPTVSAQMQIMPGDKLGESDIVIERRQTKFWRMGLSVDDSGTRSTGRYQGGATLYLDNPFSLSDAFYVSGGHDLNGKGRYGSKNYLFSYSVPFGYWLANFSLSGNKYDQTVAGDYTNYRYSGRSRYLNGQLSRVIHRNDSQKTTVYYGVMLRETHNYINDSEIEIQQRKTTAWHLGLAHRHYFDNKVLDLDVKYQQGVRWFGAKAAPEERIDEGSALFRKLTMSASFMLPFSVAEQNFRYQASFAGQYAFSEYLTSPDRFSIGGRWSVRGFDGELTLLADRGWTVQNELAWRLPYSQELYVGIDYGEVSGHGSADLIGKELMGSVVGLRGQLSSFYYDFFAGVPIHKPAGFKTDSVTLGFMVSFSY